MSVLWVVVADKGIAKIFETSWPKRKVSRLVEIELPVSRLKISEIVSDRSGQAFGVDKIRHALDPQEDPVAHATRIFAKDLSDFLEREFSQNRFEELVLVAEPAFMGRLMAALPRSICQNHLAATIPKNFTHLADPDLEERLSATLRALWTDPRRWEESGFAA